MTLLKPCRKCGTLIPHGVARCPSCEEKFQSELAARKARANRKYNKAYNAKRNPKYKRFYNSKEWQGLSAKVISDHHFRCDWCGRKLGSLREDGSIVRLEIDHIEPIQSDEGWLKRFDEKNLRCLCTQCHNERHQRFQPRGVGRKV